MSSPKIKILIVDDHRIFADGLCAMLHQLNPSFEVTIRYHVDLEDEALTAMASADLLLVDLHMPSLSGFNLMQALSKRGIETKVLIISGSNEVPEIEQALSLGAKGFVPKSLPSREMVAAIHSVLNGEVYLPKDIQDAIDWGVLNPKPSSSTPKKTNINGLRDRQLEVLELMYQGNSNAEIAAVLDVSESAVKSHISILFKAMETKNRTSTIKRAIELGLIKS